MNKLLLSGLASLSTILSTVAVETYFDKNLSDYIFPEKMISVRTCMSYNAVNTYIVLKDGRKVAPEKITLDVTNRVTGEKISTVVSSGIPNYLTVMIENTGRTTFKNIDLFLELFLLDSDYIDFLVIGSNYRGTTKDNITVSTAGKTRRKIGLKNFSPQEMLIIEALVYTTASAYVYTKIDDYILFGTENADCDVPNEIVSSYIPYLEANGKPYDTDTYVKKNGVPDFFP